MDINKCKANGGKWKDNKCVYSKRSSFSPKNNMEIYLVSGLLVVAVVTMVVSFLPIFPSETSGLLASGRPIDTMLAKVALFFDHFGIVVFAFLIWVGVKDLTEKTREQKYRWVSWSILGIGILGMIVDGGLIFTNAIGGLT